MSLLQSATPKYNRNAFNSQITHLIALHSPPFSTTSIPLKKKRNTDSTGMKNIQIYYTLLNGSDPQRKPPLKYTLVWRNKNELIKKQNKETSWKVLANTSKHIRYLQTRGVAGLLPKGDSAEVEGPAIPSVFTCSGCWLDAL